MAERSYPTSAPSGWFLRPVLAACCWALLALLAGCARHPAAVPQAPPLVQALPRMGFTIQAGAFAQPENAHRLAESLRARGLDAVFFAAPAQASEQKLYRVRFGDFPTREAALARAAALRDAGVIQHFIIVAPQEPPLFRARPEGEDGLRANLVETASNYLGVPYLWGGTSEAGFDCSGLAMAVYQLNGLRLPRSSREQYAQGTPVTLEEARKGDLLFFATGKSGAVSHVGIYVGGGSFIHAPKHGRSISKEKLAGYYRERLVGARAYI